ncbi:hypothetical protein [Streptomyces sp. MBT33]|uniref:hypothetical protein n=1 Tax=Streptomyces sp. MBT33 TaxID=1488363 RepID=UPI00190CF7C0|nr:hypothetical protein [Streptomyces sp. MBT33]MBK3639511.1 hypothetical protein [Streptomyces sp. MBT33]
MNLAQAPALSAPVTAAEYDRVQRASADAGQSVEEFVRTVVLDAAMDPFHDALERAVGTVLHRTAEDRIRHDYAE